MGAVIKLTQGKFALVDEVDFERVNQYKWCYTTRGYAHRNTGHGKWLSMHRFIMEEPIGRDIDHVNGNRLDNRRSNLRACSRSQNLCNKGPQPNNTSGYKGVSRFRKIKWQAYISVRGKRYHLGHFLLKEDAARAYDKAALKLHGKYARLNNV